jgi:hypothetical protein
MTFRFSSFKLKNSLGRLDNLSNSKKLLKNSLSNSNKEVVRDQFQKTDYYEDDEIVANKINYKVLKKFHNK